MMDDRTLSALKASIAHWEEVAEATHPANMYIGPSACALCTAFPSCVGCPVFAVTWEKRCKKTPYYEVVEARERWHTMGFIVARQKLREDFRAAAQKELDFLRSLLPDGER